jgi:diaminopimelate epimerase
MTLEFTKMHGLGNDFIVVDATRPDAVPSPQRLRALADRHTGIGFDQALFVGAPRRAGTLAYYRIFNADGSEVEQCGNGVRCVAAWLHARGRDGAAPMRLDSPGGVVEARIGDGGLVSIDMGEPDFEPRALPLDVPAAAASYRLALPGGGEVEFEAVSMGNPHAVLAVADVDAAPVATIGPALESHVAFPRRVNVGFAQRVDRAHLRLRVFERGVGETRACGTGACAAVAVGRKAGRLAREVEVALPGGTLRIDWEGPGHRLWMTGPAETSFEGRAAP